MEDKQEHQITVAPYFFVTYLDDDSHMHIAMVDCDDREYLQFLKERYCILECKLVPGR